MGAVELASLIVALAFGAVHVLGSRMRFLRKTPRSAWLSIAGGISVAYVFVHLLPELASHERAYAKAVSEAGGSALFAAESHVYVIALAGLAIFYGLERMARSAGRGDGSGRASATVFWIHLSSFAVYSVLIGYLLLHREETDLRGFLIYAVAMGLHFVVNDQGLRESHGAAYDRTGRWLLAAAPLVGWAIGTQVDLHTVAIAALFALLAGGVILNVLKEELPEERESRYAAFVVGAAAYAAILLATR